MLSQLSRKLALAGMLALLMSVILACGGAAEPTEAPAPTEAPTATTAPAANGDNCRSGSYGSSD